MANITLFSQIISKLDRSKFNKLVAKKEIDITASETQQQAGEAKARSEQAIGIANAESTKKSGIAMQESIAEIAKSERQTAEQQMEVNKVNQIKQAEIDKEKAIIVAEQNKREIAISAEAKQLQIETETKANKFKTETDATARLEAKRKDAEGVKVIGSAEADVILAKGTSEAESKKAMELANVTAQTTLAEKIGENQPYIEYLIEIKKVEVSQVIGVAQYESIATALSKADLKLLINSGDVNSGIGKITDLFTSKGASQLNGLIEGLKQTEEGKGILKIVENLGDKSTDIKTTK